MRRSPDLLRAILLAIESAEEAELLHMPLVEGHDRAVVNFHVRLLIEARLVHAEAELRGQGDWLALRLTWSGYDYLDAIRDPAVWRLVRRAAARAGSWSIETIGTIAKAMVLAKAQSLGIAINA